MTEKLKILTVTSYGDDSSDNEPYRVTVNAMNVDYVSASERLHLRGSMNLHKVYVTFADEGGAQLYINGDDLRILEEAVGYYGQDD